MNFKEICALFGGPLEVSMALGLKDIKAMDVRIALKTDKPRKVWIPKLKIAAIEMAKKNIEKSQEFLKFANEFNGYLTKEGFMCKHKSSLITYRNREIVSICKECGETSPFDLDNDKNIDALTELVSGSNKAIKEMKTKWND